MVKFAHFADVHIGGWRDPKLKNAGLNAFKKAIIICKEKKVDFICIAGDLFNTSLPSIDNLKEVTLEFKNLKDEGIPVYLVAGSHDYSPSGRTMLDVLEKAGLIINVCKGEVVDNKLKLKFALDEKTGVKITGVLGRRGMLDKSYYQDLNREHLEKEKGYKIFLWHTVLTELKPSNMAEMESFSISFLPKGFNYYGGGHVHQVMKINPENYGWITQPGPLFPNSFSELEDCKNGGLFIVEDDLVEWLPVILYNVYCIKLDCDNKTPEEVTNLLINKAEGREFNNTIITIRLFGTLKSGKLTDIDFNVIFKTFLDKSAHTVLKNTYKLKSKEFESIKVVTKTIDEAEDVVIKEHLGQISVQNFEPDKEFVKGLMKALDTNKKEGETVPVFEERIKSEIKELLNL